MSTRDDRRAVPRVPLSPHFGPTPVGMEDTVAAPSPEHEKSMPIGGGQDLLAPLTDYVTQPDRVVSVKGAHAMP